MFKISIWKLCFAITHTHTHTHTHIYIYFNILKGLSLVIVHVKSTQLRGTLIVSLAISYNGAKLGDLLTVNVKLCEILLQFCTYRKLQYVLHTTHKELTILYS